MLPLSYSLDPTSDVPAYEQLYAYIVDKICSGAMQEGEKLPSKRQLCNCFSVSMSTVEAALAILIDEGYLRAEERRGIYVCPLNFLSRSPKAKICKREKQTSEINSKRFLYAFSTNEIDMELFPYQSWAKINRDIHYDHPELMLQGDVRGEHELCEALCSCLLQHRDIDCVPRQVVIGAGFQFVLSNVLRLFSDSHEVAVEDPGYEDIYTTVAGVGKTAIPIAVDEEGIRVDDLIESGAKIAVVVPSRQFPTTVPMSKSRREQLLQWVDASEDHFLIEDDNDYEFQYGRNALPTLFNLDKSGRVIYINSFNRSISPSLPIGYAVFSLPLMDKNYMRICQQPRSVSRFAQQSLASFITSGLYTRHLLRARNIYQRRRLLLFHYLSEIKNAQIVGESSGLYFLFSLPSMEEDRMIELAAQHGVFVHGISEYYHKSVPPVGTLVLGFAGLNEQDLKHAAALLKEAFQ